MSGNSKEKPGESPYLTAAAGNCIEGAVEKKD